MATTANTAGGGNQVVGKVFILYGTVKAVSPDGTVRILAPNSPIYANEQIITGADGSISIQFDGPPVTQLDLGRMTEIVIDEDVYAGVAPEVVTEAAADAEKIQEALLAGDEEIDLEATAAGGTADGGGGHPTVVFDLDGNEVTPGSGAETEGIITSSVDPLSGVVPEGTAPPTPELTPEPEPEPVIPPPEPFFAAVTAAPTVEILEIPDGPDPDPEPEPEPVIGKVTLSAEVVPTYDPPEGDTGISHVLYIVDTGDGTIGVKINGWDGNGEYTFASPAGFIPYIEAEYGGDVTAYYIKQATSFYDQDGNEIYPIYNESIGKFEFFYGDGSSWQDDDGNTYDAQWLEENAALLGNGTYKISGA
ncbi:MAG: retention module-containing protein, partial [Desulfobacterales bacterium]